MTIEMKSARFSSELVHNNRRLTSEEQRIEKIQ